MIAAQVPFVIVSVAAVLGVLWLTFERDYGRPRWASRLFGQRRER